MFFASIVVIKLFGNREKRGNTLFAVASLVIVVILCLFRYLYYGEWVPNTFYAK